MKPRIQLRKPVLAAAITSLLVLPLTAARAQTTIISDFNNGIPDWDEKQVRGADFSETAGQLVASGNIPAGNDCITWNLSHVLWNKSLSVNEGEVSTLRVDILESSHDDVHVLLDYQATGTGGYSLAKDQDEIWFTKWRWVDCGANAPFFYEQAPVKNERVRLVLEFERVDSNLEITCKVLDLDDANAVLFERTVIDTPAVEPTISSFQGYAWSTDSGPPIFAATSCSVSVVNVAKAPQSNVQISLDNFAYERRPVLRAEKAVRLSWPASFPNMEVFGAPTVEGPWTMLTEPVVESEGEFLMTVPSPSAENYEFYRLEQP